MSSSSLNDSLRMVPVFEDSSSSPSANLQGVHVIFEPFSGSLFLCMNEYGMDYIGMGEEEETDLICGVFQMQIVEEAESLSGEKRTTLKVIRIFPNPGFVNFGGMTFDPETRHLFLLHCMWPTECANPKGVVEYALNDLTDGLQPVIVQRWPLLIPTQFNSSSDESDDDPLPPKLERMDSTGDIYVVSRREDDQMESPTDDENTPYMYVTSPPCQHMSSGFGGRICVFSRTGKFLFAFPGPEDDDEYDYCPTSGISFDPHRGTILAGEDHIDESIYEYSLSGKTLGALEYSSNSSDSRTELAVDSLRDLLLIRNNDVLKIFRRSEEDDLNLLATISCGRGSGRPAVDEENGIAYLCCEEENRRFQMLNYGSHFPITIRAWNRRMQTKNLFQLLWKSLHKELFTRDSTNQTPRRSSIKRQRRC